MAAGLLAALLSLPIAASGAGHPAAHAPMVPVDDTWCRDPRAPPKPGMYGPSVSFQLSRVPLIEPPEAQLLFNQALMLEFAFNRVESRRNFEHVVRLSPRCALCWWGVARSYSSNINHDIENYTLFNEVAARALAELRPEDGPKVSMMVHSMQHLRVPGAMGNGTKALVNASRHALAEHLCANHTTDADVAALCADALMTTSPWDYYDGPRLKAIMEPAWEYLRRDVSPSRAPHPLSLHLFIHLAEPSTYDLNSPLIGQLAADALDGMVRGAGHLDHMAAHVYQQVGRYAAGVRASRRALGDNDAYLKNCLTPYGMGHNLHVGVFNSVYAGQHGSAVEFAQRQITAADEGAEVGVVDVSEPQSAVSPYSSALALVNLRFGQWAEAVEAASHSGHCGQRCQAIPAFRKNTADFAAHHAVKQMVLGFANEAAGRSSDEQSAIVGPPPLDAPARSLGSFRDNLDRRPQMALVAAKYELAARRAYTRGDLAYTLAALRNLSRFLDAQPYMEPEMWYYDPRTCLGYVLLTHGEHGAPDPAAALEAYTAALSRRPRTPWALIGAAQAYAALNHSGAAANPYGLQLQAAAKDADVKITSSCPQYARAAPLV